VFTVAAATALVLGVPAADPTVGALVLVLVLAVALLGAVAPSLAVRSVRPAAAASVVSAAGTPVRHPVVVGDELTVEIPLTARNGVTIGWPGAPSARSIHVGGAGVVVPARVERRGRFADVVLEARSDAPFGMAVVRRQLRVPLERTLVVGPRPVPVEASEGSAPAAQWESGTGDGRATGDEVRAVRPYVRGDPAHLVHWPTSAHVGSLVVRELEPPRARGIAVVVHTAAAGGDAAEATLGRAAGCALDALARGAAVVLCVPGEESARPVGGRDELLDVLAGATDGAPPPPPAGWDVAHVTPDAPISPTARLQR
jgi:uncharacterized protein (DUF58 family)